MAYVLQSYLIPHGPRHSLCCRGISHDGVSPVGQVCVTRSIFLPPAYSPPLTRVSLYCPGNKCPVLGTQAILLPQPLHEQGFGL